MSDESKPPIVLLPEIASLDWEKLRAMIESRSLLIARQTPGTPNVSWDFPEEYQLAAVELAHAVVRYSASPASGSPELLSEGLRILDELHERFLFDKSSDSRIDAIERADARLRVILRLLADARHQ